MHCAPYPQEGAEPPRREPPARQGTLHTLPVPGGPRRGAEPHTHRRAAGSNPQRRRSAPALAGARCGAQTPSPGAHIQAPATQLKVLLRCTQRASPPPASDRCHLSSPRPPAPRHPPAGGSIIKRSLTCQITHRQRCRSSPLLTGHPSERRAGGSEGGEGEREGRREGRKEWKEGASGELRGDVLRCAVRQPGKLGGALRVSASVRVSTLLDTSERRLRRRGAAGSGGGVHGAQSAQRRAAR